MEKKRIEIIHNAGQVQSAILLDTRTRVERKEQFWIPELERYVAVAPYDNHFLYENDVEKQPSYLCTCGIHAVMLGYKDYAQDASPANIDGGVPGELFVCYAHALSGKHADGTT
jgi:hypothetical protein